MSFIGMLAVTLIGLIGVWMLETRMLSSPVIPIALLIIGSNGIIAILLPYTSESYPLHIRARSTGWIAACTKGGGVIAQTLSITALVPALGIAAAMIMLPVLASLALFVKFGTETRGLDLRELEVRRG